MTAANRTSTGGPSVRPAGRAFTMVELMVVLIVVIILATIALGLANRVTEGGKQTQTENTIRALDQVLTEYKASYGARPPAWVTTDQTMAETYPTNPTDPSADVYDSKRFFFPLVDGRYEGRSNDIKGQGLTGASNSLPDLDPAQPTVGLFLLLAAQEAGGIDTILKGFDAKIVSRQDVWAHGWEKNSSDEPTGSIQHRRLRIPVILDGFGQPIRFVHPSFDGGPAPIDVNPYHNSSGPGTVQFSRAALPGNAVPDAVGDSDEGICVGKNPYFYSAGGDFDPGTRDDNVYSIEPTFPQPD